MKGLTLTRRGFPSKENGVRILPYSQRAILRAVIAAGRRPGPVPRTGPAWHDIQMRLGAVRSAIDLSGPTLRPTSHFRMLGRTDKAHKSYFIGSALCAHAAYEDLSIPWLVDVERSALRIKKGRFSKGRRPDFLGLTPGRQWHVFESKGRGSQPSAANLSDWKRQARAIAAVEGRAVTHNIVSVAHISRAGDWEVLWVDPEPDDGAVDLELSIFDFLSAYYTPIQTFLAELPGRLDTAAGGIAYLESWDAFVGLHRDVETALAERNSESIITFAQRRGEQVLTALSEFEDGVFADGLVIVPNAGPRGRRTSRPEPSSDASEGTPMNSDVVGQPERATQERLIALFRDELSYRFLGDWTDRDGNSNVEDTLLTAFLLRSGYDTAHINRAIDALHRAADHHGRTLYQNNQAVYDLLRYGVKVKAESGENTEDVWLINWENAAQNDFAIAEEVTLRRNHERRPDLVLYVNGIAIGVIELKNSRVSIGDGIRQCLSNQQPEFNEWFFSTVQFVFAGNDSEGLRYGTTGTPEKFFLTWKEDEQNNSRFKLDKYLLKMCAKSRLLELMHDFVLFDGGVKKLPRVHQYAGVKAAQTQVRQRKGGIIWHTQGSGKSIVMVLLAKWILEHNPHARVAIITDRDELDKQIHGVFTGAGVEIARSRSGRELLTQLGEVRPRLLCSLVHKFGRRDVDDFDSFIQDLEAQPAHTVGEVFVFVDECHRTQSGKLHRIMKAMMPNAVFIGFTGTPLLKKDAATSLEVFGSYIHTYKFSEGVEDGVVLDLVYEARDIDQTLGSVEKIDAWFEAKTKGLNEWQKDELKKQWGTMQNVLSSKSRMDRVVSDVVFDFGVKPRLSSARGNAILVASSIYEACKYFTLFQKTPFKGKCAVVTSYNPEARDVTKEEVGANTETDRQFIYNTYNDLLEDVDAKPGMTRTETYEERAKALFVKEPANMKLLVVVDKLLTGFDAPPCTYLYIDKSMQDHGLFQAICRVNRLDTDDKDFGYIVDYKDLFKKVEHAIAVYTSELDHSAPGADPEVLIHDRLTKGRERLDQALEALALLCEPVVSPRGELEHIHYFCGNTEIASDLEEREPKRVALYKGTVGLIRAYGSIADELAGAGYSDGDVARIRQQLNHYLNVREIIRKASGESLDLKPYEADMRHLIDTYIEAAEPRKISPFDNMGLLELIVKTGIADAIASELGGLKGDRNAIAETIENNVRRTIIKEHLNDPAYYEKMSELLDEIIRLRKEKAISYEEYLRRVADAATRVKIGYAPSTPPQLDTPGKRALYSNLKAATPSNRAAEKPPEDSIYANSALSVALRIDETVKRVRPAAWRGVRTRENVIKGALLPLLGDSEAEVERIFKIIFAQREY